MNKAGRPDRRTNFTVRLTPEECAALRDYATRHGYTIAFVARQALIDRGILDAACEATEERSEAHAVFESILPGMNEFLEASRAIVEITRIAGDRPMDLPAAVRALSASKWFDSIERLVDHLARSLRMTPKESFRRNPGHNRKREDDGERDAEIA